MKQAAVLFISLTLVLATTSILTSGVPVFGYDVAPHCDLSHRTQQNDNSLVEVNVIYDNGTYIQDAQVTAAAYWGSLRLMNQTYDNPLICLTAIAGQESVFWTVHVNDHPIFKWVWTPKTIGEHQLVYLSYPADSRGAADIRFYDANSINANSLPELSPVAATITTIIALAVASYATNTLRVSRKSNQ